MSVGPQAVPGQWARSWAAPLEQCTEGAWLQMLGSATSQACPRVLELLRLAELGLFGVVGSCAAVSGPWLSMLGRCARWGTGSGTGDAHAAVMPQLRALLLFRGLSWGWGLC
ncbi:hypothetical protein NDU88_001310 [Pleurodeles waltl]|uniref:Uncharacterized protein n=1 Tax=Pleurodeles waltl TaxID=8319 RepID=A0AAV7S9F6_PLEWA|nr:hypothetical protein NDU88_001310 [Pleurodeles waltl]